MKYTDDNLHQTGFVSVFDSWANEKKKNYKVKICLKSLKNCFFF